MSSTSQSNKRSLAVRAVVAAGAALFWAVSVILMPAIFATAPLQRGALVALEIWVCSVAVTASVWAAILYQHRIRAHFYELGYIGRVMDELEEHESTIVPMARYKRRLGRVNGDRRDSNKVS